MEITQPPVQAQKSIDVLEGFYNSLYELEAYLAQHNDSKVAKTFKDFKTALAEADTKLQQTVEVKNNEVAPAIKKQEYYLSMSSLMSPNLKLKG